MNNADVLRELTACDAELAQVRSLIDGLGVTSNIVPYLTKYAVIRACGSIELSFKTIIADYCVYRSKKQVKRFIDRRVREGSANPSIENINRFLNDFDEGWRNSFKAQLNGEVNKSVILTSLQSLVDARNDFAHGGSPSATILDVIAYFSHARRVIEIMDTIIV
jgi:hypothetical protein